MDAKYKRFGRVLKLKPEYEEEYKKYHANVWPSISEAISRAGMRNYSIFLKDGYMFAYLEMPEGSDLVKMQQQWMENKDCRKWEEIMNRMQERIEGAKPGEWWAEMEEVFHQD